MLNSLFKYHKLVLKEKPTGSKKDRENMA